MELDFGAWLKKRRRALDLTQGDLAERAFCSVTTIRKIEAGNLVPSKVLAGEIAHAVGVPPDLVADFVRFARTPSTIAPENAFREAPADEDAPPERDDEPTPQPAHLFHPPAPLTAALGREHDTGVIARALRLPATRLITLTGPPGIGKTRLSIEVANELQTEFANGAAFVVLAPIAEYSLVDSAIAQALDVRSAGNTPLLSTLRAFLRDKQLLLVLDNFEHVLDAAPLVTDLLSHAPGLKILATSRERLRLYGERELPIAPLGLPPLTPLPPWNELENYAAVQLFVERAQAVNPSFELNAQNAEAVARLCVGLEGLPLAVEMAAARVKWETPQELVPQLTRRLESFKARSREYEPRQQTLRGAIDWSYDRLDEREQQVLRQLGVFRGGFTRDAADAVCGFSSGEFLESLTEKSLVKQDGETRSILLEMIREYALEKLEAHGELETAQASHAAYYAAFAEQNEPMLRSVSGFELAHLLDPDLDNLRAAVEWSIVHRQGALAMRLAGSLSAYWDRTSATGEAIRWLERVLALEVEPDEDMLFARAKARDAYAEFIRLNGDYARAREILFAALDDWRRAGARGKPFLVSALIPSSRVALDQGDDALAYELGLEALKVSTELQEKAGQSQAWRRLADWALTGRNYAAAEEYLVHAMQCADEVESEYDRATTLRLRGDFYRVRGDYARAQADYARALELNYDSIKDDYATVRMTRSLGVIAMLQGDIPRGVALVLEAAQLAHTLGNYAALALAFCNGAFAAALQGNARRALRLLGAMDRLNGQVKMRLIAPDLIEYERTLELVEARERGSEGGGTRIVV